MRCGELTYPCTSFYRTFNSLNSFYWFFSIIIQFLLSIENWNIAAVEKSSLVSTKKWLLLYAEGVLAGQHCLIAHWLNCKCSSTDFMNNFCRHCSLMKNAHYYAHRFYYMMRKFYFILKLCFLFCLNWCNICIFPGSIRESFVRFLRAMLSPPFCVDSRLYYILLSLLLLFIFVTVSLSRLAFFLNEKYYVMLNEDKWNGRTKRNKEKNFLWFFLYIYLWHPFHFTPLHLNSSRQSHVIVLFSPSIFISSFFPILFFLFRFCTSSLFDNGNFPLHNTKILNL